MPSDEDVSQRAGSRRAMTGVTDMEFQALLPVCEHAFERSMATRTLDRHPRTSRRESAYVHCPLPTTAAKLLFLLTSMQQHPMHVVPGQLCGMSQSNANQWRHLLHAIGNQTFADQDLLPARTADDLATLLARHKPDATTPSPRWGTMRQSD